MKSQTHLLQNHFLPHEGSRGAQLHAPTALKIPILKLCSDKIFDSLLQTTNPKLPNNLIFQAEDYLLCVGSSFSLHVSMHAVNHCVQDNYNSRIPTPHLVHLRLWPPVSPGFMPHRSRWPSSTLGTVLRLNESPHEGSVPFQGLPRAAQLMCDSQRADIM